MKERLGVLILTTSLLLIGNVIWANEKTMTDKTDPVNVEKKVEVKQVIKNSEKEQYPQWYKENALLINPVQIALTAAIGGITVNVEYQRTLLPFLAWYIMPEFAMLKFGTSTLTGIGGVTGLYLFPFGHHLDGLYLRAGGMAAYYLVGAGFLGLGGEALIGYQIVFKNSFVLSFGGGVRLITLAGTSVMTGTLELAKIGFAF